MKRLRYALGALLAVVALWASLRHVNHDAIRDAMHAASLPWTLAALAATLTTLVIVTWRWGLLLGLGATRHWGRLWHAVVVGQAVNIVFPLRFGEAARIGLMARGMDWPVGRVTAALAVERVCDGAAFATVVALLVVSGRLPNAFAGALPTALLIAGVTLASAIAGVFLLPRMLRLIPDSTSSRLGRWILRQASGVEAAWSALRGWRLAVVALLTGVVLVSSASTNYLVFRAFDLPVPIVAAFVLLAVLQFGTAVVSVPGNLGVFQYLTVLTLAAWNIPPSQALAASVVLHVVSLGPRVVLGAIMTLASWPRPSAR